MRLSNGKAIEIEQNTEEDSLKETNLVAKFKDNTKNEVDHRNN